MPLGDLLLARRRLQILAQPVVDGQEQGLLLNDVLGDGLVVQIVDRAGDVAGAEAGVDARIDFEVAVAGGGGQVEGVGGADDGGGLGLGEGAQADPVGQVGVEPAEFTALDALTGQQQVDADGSADASDGQEQVDEIGAGGEKLAELVDDDEQVRHGRHLGAGPAQAPVVADVRGGAGVAQLLLAADDLAGDGGAGPLDQSGVVGEVVHEADDVRQVGEGGEGRAALVVDEDHGQVLGTVGDGQRRDEGAQQLGLARAGGAHAQAVGADAQLGRLLEVEEDRRAVVVRPDGHAQEVAGRARRPRPADVDGAGVVHSQQVLQRGLGGVLVLALRAPPQAEGGEGPADALGEGGPDDVGGADDRIGDPRAGRLPGSGRQWAQVLDEDGAVLLDGQAHGGVAGLVKPVGDQVDLGDSEVLGAQSRIGDLEFPGVAVVLDDGEQAGPAVARTVPVRPDAVVAGRRPGHRDDLGVQDAVELGDVRAHAAQGDGAVEQAVDAQVGESGQAVPFGRCLGAVGQGDVEVLGGVVDRRPGHQGPGDRARGLARADERDRPGAVKVQGEGRAAEHRVGRDDGFGLPEEDRVDLGRGAGRHGRQRCGEVGDPQPQCEEVLVRAAPLPAAFGSHRQAREAQRRGMSGQQAAAVLLAERGGPLIGLAQAVQIVLAAPGPLPDHGGAAGHEGREHGDGGDDHGDGSEQREDGVGAHEGHHEHR